MTAYVGFGPNCLVSEILTRGGLREFSLPFDFMFAFPCHIKRSLDVDFSDWLDPQYLEAIPRIGQDYTATKHSMYDSHTYKMRQSDPTKTYAFFNHHNLLESKDREIFERRIARYKEIIASGDRVIFVTTASISDIKSEGLHEYYKNRNGQTAIVYLENAGKEEDSAYLVEDSEDYIIKYTCPEEYTDNLSKIICNILKQI